MVKGGNEQIIVAEDCGIEIIVPIHSIDGTKDYMNYSVS